MFDTIHVMAGLTIGKYIPNLFMALGIGIVSHFFLDAIPHWDGSKILTTNYPPKKNSCRQCADCLLEESSAGGNQVWESQKKQFTKQGKIILGLDILATILVFLFLSITGKLWPNFPDLSSFFFFFFSHPSLLTGVFGALLPDILLLIHIWFGLYRPRWLFLLDFHKKLQEKKLKPLPSLVMQAIFLALLLFYFYL